MLFVDSWKLSTNLSRKNQ